MLHQNQVFAFGLGLPPSYLSTATSALAGEATEAPKEFSFGATQHKKHIHCYKVTETKWLDMNETFFGGAHRRDSTDFDD